MLSDDEIRKAFHSYTQMILDLTTNLAYDNSSENGGLYHNGVPLSQIYLNRTRKLKNSYLYRSHCSLTKTMHLDYHNGISLGTIKNHMRSLRTRGWPDHPLSDLEVHKIFKDIDTFIQDTASAEKILYLLPYFRDGIGRLAHGLFFDHDQVQEHAARILLKLKKSGRSGETALREMSEFL